MLFLYDDLGHLVLAMQLNLNYNRFGVYRIGKNNKNKSK